MGLVLIYSAAMIQLAPHTTPLLALSHTVTLLATESSWATLTLRTLRAVFCRVHTDLPALEPCPSRLYPTAHRLSAEHAAHEWDGT